MSSPKPLWEVMYDAAVEAVMRPAGLRATAASQEAARLRAIAVWIEKAYSAGAFGPHEEPAIQCLIAMLRIEADRAEAGANSSWTPASLPGLTYWGKAGEAGE